MPLKHFHQWFGTLVPTGSCSSSSFVLEPFPIFLPFLPQQSSDSKARIPDALRQNQRLQAHENETKWDKNRVGVEMEQ